MEKSIKSFDGTKIFYKINRMDDKKPTMVFIHGLSCNITVWKDIAPFFEKNNYSVILSDLRGHGKSDKKADISFEKAAKDINIILEKENIKDAILIANCFGTGIALQCYHLHPEKIRKMAFITPTYINPLKYHNKIVNKFTNLFYNMLKKGLKYTKVKDRAYTYSDHTRDKKSRCLTLYLKNFKDNPLRTHLACFYQLMVQDDSKILPKINAPVLILAAEKDFYTPLKISEDLKKMIRNSELEIIKGMDHAMMIRIPEKINKLIYNFIK